VSTVAWQPTGAELWGSVRRVFGPRPYERSRVLEEAEQARAKGRRKKAVSGYREILQHEPEDAAVHGKLAPLLVDDEPWSAWLSFEKAAQAHLAKGFVDRAIAVYRQAAEALPFLPEAWEQVSGLQLQRGRRADAVKALLDGQHFFWRKKSDAPTLVRLLKKAVELDPLAVEPSVALARALRRANQRAEALALLDGLLPKVEKPQRRRVLRARLAVAPGLGAVWAWLRG